MPAAEVDVSASLVRSLIESQRPDLAGSAVTLLGEGWDNWLFRIGERWLARLPRRSLSAPLIENEWDWLPELAPHLPLQVPLPLHLGRPDFNYPFPWAIYPFLEGTPASRVALADFGESAATLGRFLVALHQPAPSDAPLNPFRGVPLSERDESTRWRLDGLRQESFPGVGRLQGIWEEAVDLPEYSGPPVWLHGDFHPSNLLVEEGNLCAVVDWGDITAGDPAVDLAVGWMLLPSEARVVLGSESGASGDTWGRARGWSLSLGLAMLMTSVDNPRMGEIGHRTIRAILEDS